MGFDRIKSDESVMVRTQLVSNFHFAGARVPSQSSCFKALKPPVTTDGRAPHLSDGARLSQCRTLGVLLRSTPASMGLGALESMRAKGEKTASERPPIGQSPACLPSALGRCFSLLDSDTLHVEAGGCVFAIGHQAIEPGQTARSSSGSGGGRLDPLKRVPRRGCSGAIKASSELAAAFGFVG